MKSVNLYQLFSYLMNQRTESPLSWHTTGILLYPTTREELNLDYQYHGHTLMIKTVNLGQGWRGIEERLEGIVNC